MVKVIIISSFEFFLMIVLVAGKEAGEKECRVTRCAENEPEIRFPFRLKDSQPAHCGYPGFDLSCTSSNETALELPNVPMKFFVEYIDYEFQMFGVSSQVECGFQKQNLELLSLRTSPFQFIFPGTTLFNCSSNSQTLGPSDFRSETPCIANHKHFVRAYSSNDDMSNALPELVTCTKMIEISSVPPEIFTTNSLVALRWLKPSCEHCEAKGKRCRLKKNGTEIDETECFKLSKLQKGKSTSVNEFLT